MTIKKSDWYLIALAVFVLALSLFVGGCTLTQPKPTVPDLPASVADKQTVTVDEQLIAPCSPLPQLDLRPYSESDTLDPISSWSNVYTDCSERFAKYVGITAKLLNINKNLDPQKGASDTPSTSK